MDVPYRCPVHHEPLVAQPGGGLRAAAHGEEYPVIEGIPVLLADPAERARVAASAALRRGGPTARGGADAADFYNERLDAEGYYDDDDVARQRRHLEGWMARLPPRGPVLEIGSGGGGLQGLGGEYVAADYSLAALRRCIDPRYQRVCCSASDLPFPDASFGWIFTARVLEHVAQADRAFAEIDRVLRPGGTAYLHPSWHCVQYICEGVPVRPYGDLSWRQKLVKLSLPIRKMRAVKAAGALPRRVFRRATWALGGRKPTAFRFRRLRPDYTRFWMSDSDAASRLDAHEGCLFFVSRRYKLWHPAGGAVRQLLLGSQPIVACKPTPGPARGATPGWEQ